jgi:hypothetical protein
VLHLIKLCVGCDSIRDLEEWIAEQLNARKGANERNHTTRMTPKRAAEILGSDSYGKGSLDKRSLDKRSLDKRSLDKRSLDKRSLDGRSVGNGSDGSLYWVIRGQIMCRERILDIRPFTDKDGTGRCHIVLDCKPVPVEPRPCRAFQGWRYLPAADAPPDLDRAVPGACDMPEDLRRELRNLGLL